MEPTTSSERLLSRRQQFLEAGAAIVEETGVQSRLTFTVQDLLDRLPDEVTRGAFTNIWPRREDFEEDLVEFLLDAGRWSEPGDLEAVLVPLGESGEPLRTLIREGASYNFKQLRGSRRWRTFMELWSLSESPTLGDLVRRNLGNNYRDLDKEYSDLYRLLLLVYKRRMRSGLHIEDLTLALGAVVEGYVIRWSVDSEAVREDIKWTDGANWSVVAVTVEAIVEHFTEPLEGS